MDGKNCAASRCSPLYDRECLAIHGEPFVWFHGFLDIGDHGSTLFLRMACSPGHAVSLSGSTVLPPVVPLLFLERDKNERDITDGSTAAGTN